MADNTQPVCLVKVGQRVRLTQKAKALLPQVKDKIRTVVHLELLRPQGGQTWLAHFDDATALNHTHFEPVGRVIFDYSTLIMN